MSPLVRYKLVIDDNGYRVGDDGSIWTRLRRIGLGKGGGVKYGVGSIWVKMSPTIHKSGHLSVRLRGVRRYVHQLVLEAFIGPCPDGMEARHFPDRNPTNNAASNLLWGTHRQNILDQREHRTDNAGERNGQAKLTNETAKSMKTDLAAGMSCSVAAKKYKISRTQARRIAAGARWGHIMI